jgi:hypothetical protein
MMAAYGTYTDQELLVLLKTGDRTAFAEIFNKYRSLLFSHVYWRFRQ